jgi:uncharacterized iron-regulated membrane protein
MNTLVVLTLCLVVVLAGLLGLWLWIRPAAPDPSERDDLRRADDGAEPDPGKGLGSASYWPTV